MKELTQPEVVKLQVGESIKGKYISCDESAQYKDSYALKLETEQGNKVYFVNNIVRDTLKENGIEVGQTIEVKYTGTQKTADGKHEYKTYKVFAE